MEGDLAVGINLSVVTRSRVVVERFKTTNKGREKCFITERDPVQLGCVGRARRHGTEVAIEQIELARPLMLPRLATCPGRRAPAM